MSTYLLWPHTWLYTFSTSFCTSGNLIDLEPADGDFSQTDGAERAVLNPLESVLNDLSGR